MTDDTNPGRLSRRNVIASLGAAGVAGLAGCAGGGGGDGDGGGGDGGGTPTGDGGDGDGGGTTTGDTSASGTVRIGIVQPLTGDLQYYGQQSIWGFSSGLAYKTDTEPAVTAETGQNTVEAGDVTYELFVRDTELNPGTAQQRATELIQNEDVDMLFGASSSASAERIINTVVSQANVPYVAGPAASTSITSSSDLCSEMVFRASENTAMDARTGGTYVARNTDIERVYLMGANYSFGKSVVNNYRSVLEAEGIEVVGERLVNQGYDEFDGLFEEAVNAGAQGVVGGFTVRTLPQFMQTAVNYDVRIFGGFATEITNGIVGSTLTQLLGEPLTAQKIRDARIGPFTTRYHWNQFDNPINDDFVDIYTGAYEKVPDLFTAGTFTAASAIVQGVTASGSTEGADVASAMRGMTVTDTPKGENGYRFQEYNNQARSAMTIAYPVPTADDLPGTWKASIMPETPPTQTIGMDQTTIPADSDLMDCSL